LSPTLLFALLGKSSGKDEVYAKAKKTDAKTEDDGKDDHSTETEADDENEGLKPRRRKPNRD
jgi:hypothetical protein